MWRTQTELAATLAEVLQVPVEDLASYEGSLLDFGMDSIQVMTLAEQFQAKGIPVSFVGLAQEMTLSAWWRHIQTVQRGRHDESPA